MILDRELQMNNNTALTNTQVSTDVIDLSQRRDIGAGYEMDLLVSVSTTFLSAGASTLVAVLQTDTQSSFATAVALMTSPAIPKASLTAGFQIFAQKVPEGVQRYLRMSYTVATADFTAGNINAAILLDKPQPLLPTQAYYPSGLNTGGF